MSGRRLEMRRRAISNPQCRRIMPLQHEARDLHFFHLTYETLMCLLHLNILFYTQLYTFVNTLPFAIKQQSFTFILLFSNKKTRIITVYKFH